MEQNAVEAGYLFGVSYQESNGELIEINDLRQMMYKQFPHLDREGLNTGLDQAIEEHIVEYGIEETFEQ